MKRLAEYKGAIVVSLLTVLCVAVLVLSQKITKIPGAVTYHAGNNDNPVQNAILSNSEKVLYDSVKDISEDGPYHIEVMGENLYVSSKNKCLYKIKAKTMQFSEYDLENIFKNLEMNERNTLYEIVEYMES